MKARRPITRSGRTRRRILQAAGLLAGVALAERASADLLLERVIDVNQLIPDRGQYVSSIVWPVVGITSITSVKVNLQLSSPNASNPMWLGDMVASLTYGVASEDERVGVLFNRPGVTQQDPWGSSASSLNQSYSFATEFDGSLLASNRWTMLVGDQMAGGVGRLNRWSISITGAVPESGDFDPGSGGTIQLVEGATSLTVDRPVELGSGTGDETVKARPNAGQTMTWSSGIKGAGQLVKEGDGKLVLSGVSSEFSGTLKVDAGEVEITNANGLGSGGLEFSGDGARLKLAQNLNLSNAIALGNNANRKSEFAVDSGATTLSGALSGSGQFDKRGSGRLTITSNNESFTGKAIATEGILDIASGGRVAGNAEVKSGAVLRVDGAVGGAVTVDSGATLAGTGTIEGATTVSGDHTPGASPGLQTFSSGLTYNSTSSLEWELSANTATTGDRGVLFDAINVTGGNLTIDSGATLNLVFTSPLSNNTASTVTWFDSFWDSNRSWTIIDYSGGGSSTGNFTLGTIGTALGGWAYDTVRPGSGFSVSNSGGDIVLNWTTAVAIPEPSASLLSLLGLTGLCLRRKVGRAR
jgi:autotransporter-associated beta strand protein